MTELSYRRALWQSLRRHPAWGLAVSVITLGGFSVFSIPPAFRFVRENTPGMEYVLWAGVTVAAVGALYVFGENAWRELAAERATDQRRRERASHYAALLQEGWKRQVDWQGSIDIAAPTSAELWRQKVCGELANDFDRSVVVRFNRGATVHIHGSPQQFTDHLKRLDTLDAMIQEMRDGRLD